MVVGAGKINQSTRCTQFYHYLRKWTYVSQDVPKFEWHLWQLSRERHILSKCSSEILRCLNAVTSVCRLGLVQRGREGVACLCTLCLLREQSNYFYYSFSISEDDFSLFLVPAGVLFCSADRLCKGELILTGRIKSPCPLSICSLQQGCWVSPSLHTTCLHKIPATAMWAEAQ